MEVEHPHGMREAEPGSSGSDPRVAAAFVSRAKAWHGEGRLDNAEREYRAALAAQPDHREALRFYGILQQQRGNLADAEALLLRAAALAPDADVLADLGAVFAARGGLDAALAQFDAALALDRLHVPSLVRRGNALMGLRRVEPALDAYDRALAVSPLLSDALCNRGSALRALGRLQEALDSYARALTVDPRSFESHCNLGNVLRDLHRYAEALLNYDRALSIVPNQPQVLSARGRTLIDLDRPKDALASFNEAIATQPDFVEALYNSAVALERLGRPQEALQRCARVLALEPGHAKAHATRGNALLHLKQFDDALQAYARALELEPGSPDALCNQGTALRELGRHDEALQCYDAALARAAQLPQAWCNRGNVLQEQQRFDAALESFDRALALDPSYVTAWFNRGSALFEMHRFDDALAAHDRALALDPHHVDAHFAQGFILLRQGDFERGWSKYEWRLRNPGNEHAERVFAQPRWSGDTPLDGRTILIYAEQGFGDTLQFCRYATLLRDAGARVVLEVQPALRALMGSLSGPAEVIAAGDAPPPFDCHCPLPSLPFSFGTGLPTIPARTPYLHADPALARQWADRLGERRRPRVGLAWSGNPGHRNDRHRSMDFSMFAPLLDLDVEWISVQKDARAQDAALLARTPVRRFDADLRDFSDTAALIRSLDLVVTVDTSVAHLTGALGRPVWILLPHLSEWRWLTGRDDSPWYPDARLFRQTRTGDWPHVVEAVRGALAERMRQDGFSRAEPAGRI
ncbi:tetratricopeptide repeat protein [Burkholderia alba]|uniref:tetratricopeptide repeat protein n=1 Tax=Burkholderia alba TaxID=2683677 RepID=UPI002B05B673|nr:tetratricopeptide repeat protein [Burkholderia alba]